MKRYAGLLANALADLERRARSRLMMTVLLLLLYWEARPGAGWVGWGWSEYLPYVRRGLWCVVRAYTANKCYGADYSGDA